MSKIFPAVFFLVSVLLPTLSGAECYFRDHQNGIRKVPSMEHVPARYRPFAKCNAPLKAPDKIKNKGNKRKVEANSPWGRIHLFWSSDIEDKLPSNPANIVVSALREAERFVGSSLGISTKDIPGGDSGWQIVIINNDAEVPMLIRRGCHPGWMTAPSNIYLYAKKIFADCRGRKLSKAAIKQNFYSTLIHEIGHVVEHGLLRNPVRDSQRAEGFAAWFESSIIPASKSSYLAAAKKAAAKGATQFRGGYADYGLASAYFHALVDIKRRAGIREFYRKYRESPKPLPDAILALGVGRKRLEDSVNKILK